jgi:hypothetical protein
LHLAELGTIATAAVAAGVHGGTEKIGAGEAADEDGDEKATDAPRALYGTALVEGDAAGSLGAGESLDLFDEDRDELDRDDEDQNQLVDRNSKSLQRAEDEVASIIMVVT